MSVHVYSLIYTVVLYSEWWTVSCGDETFDKIRIFTVSAKFVQIAALFSAGRFVAILCLLGCGYLLFFARYLCYVCYILCLSTIWCQLFLVWLSFWFYYYCCSILTLYIGVVYTAGRFIRSYFVGMKNSKCLNWK